MTCISILSFMVNKSIIYNHHIIVRKPYLTAIKPGMSCWSATHSTYTYIVNTVNDPVMDV